jgi:dipeptidyl aminopeptidase/acylaminoacyl peptidase
LGGQLGWLTALSLARRSDLFAAGVVISGVHDLSRTSFGPLLNPDARALAKASSAAGSIDQWRSPVLIVHGGMDNTVPFSQALALEHDLKIRQQPVETLYFPREGHALQLERDWSEMFDRVTTFLDRTLKR